MYQKKLIGLTLAALLACPALSSADALEDAVDYRSGVMEVMGWNLRQIGAILKGDQPMDPKVLARRAQDLNSAAHLDILAGFPEDSVSDESDAKDEIWLDWETFTEHLDNVRRHAKALAEAARKNDPQATSAAFNELRKACKACHQDFRK